MVAVPDSRAVRRPANIPFDGTHIFDSDQLLWGGITHIPRRVVFGASAADASDAFVDLWLECFMDELVTCVERTPLCARGMA